MDEKENKKEKNKSESENNILYHTRLKLIKIF